MAMDKKVLLVFTDITPETLKNSGKPAIKKVMQKAAVAPLTIQNDLKTEAGAGAPKGEMIWDAAKKEGFIVEPLNEGGEIWMAETSDEAALDDMLQKAMEEAGNKLLTVVASKNGAVFYGYGIERGKTLDKAIPAAAIAPTVAFLADLPFPADVEAAIAYPLIKGLNFKLKQIRKLMDANTAMMTAMERENRKPWDKHDCA